MLIFLFSLQFLSRLCRQLAGVKTQGSNPALPSGPFISGHTSTLGSRASLRQGGAPGPPNISSGYQAGNTSTMNTFPNMGSLHQSLPRHQHHHIQSPNQMVTCTTSTTMHTTTTTTTHTNTMLGVSTPAHLNSVNIDEEASYKSFSRDSGHGGSEQEDSPRTHWTNTHHHHQQPLHQSRYTNSLSADLKNSYLAKLNRLNTADGNSNRLNLDNGNNLHLVTSSPFPYIEGGNKQVASIPNSYTTSLNPNLAALMKTSSGRGPSPWNHTYMEIDHHEGDPVYEEIERERWGRINGNSSEIIQVSDLSDEDVKRATPSDTSRQSSRSYGDSKPLLPYYSQQQQQQLRQQQHQQKTLHQYQQEQYALNEDRLHQFNATQAMEQEQYQMVLSQEQQINQHLQLQQLQQQHLSRENLMTVAVLNGEQVVCRLSSPSHRPANSALNSPTSQQQQQQQYQHHPQSMVNITPSNSSSLATSPASNGCPAHIVISRQQHVVPHQQLYNEC